MIGNRVYLARIEKHNGSVNDAGVPTYDTPGDWDLILSGWPCELVSISEGETTRGRQVTATDRTYFKGDPLALEGIGLDATCRIIVDETAYAILGIHGANALSIEASIEVALET